MSAQEGYYTAIPVLIMTCSALAPWRIARVSQLILITPFIKLKMTPSHGWTTITTEIVLLSAKRLNLLFEGATDVRQDDEMDSESLSEDGEVEVESMPKCYERAIAVSFFRCIIRWCWCYFNPGTAPFIANVVLLRLETHQGKHDLESILYTLIYARTAFQRPSQSPCPTGLRPITEHSLRSQMVWLQDNSTMLERCGALKVGSPCWLWRYYSQQKCTLTSTHSSRSSGLSSSPPSLLGIIGTARCHTRRWVNCSMISTMCWSVWWRTKRRSRRIRMDGRRRGV